MCAWRCNTIAFRVHSNRTVGTAARLWLCALADGTPYSKSVAALRDDVMVIGYTSNKFCFCRFGITSLRLA